MEHYQKIKCLDCEGTKVCKNGHSRNGTQRFVCQAETCQTRSVQLIYHKLLYMNVKCTTTLRVVF